MLTKYSQKYVTRENIYNNNQGYVWMDGDTMIEISEGLNKNMLIIYTNVVALKENEETPREQLMREL